MRFVTNFTLFIIVKNCANRLRFDGDIAIFLSATFRDSEKPRKILHYK